MEDLRKSRSFLLQAFIIVKHLQIQICVT